METDEALAKLQATELDILSTVASFCESHKINWFLDAGTLLGAARHKGFIPWDDDIDIAMLRADYDRFIALASKGLPEGYSLHTYDNTQGYSAMFAKVYRDGTRFDTLETLDSHCEQGIFIDIFPYDLLDADPLVERRQRRGAKWWQSISYLYHSAEIVVPHRGILGSIEAGACRLAHHLVQIFTSRETIQKRFDSLIQRVELNDDDIVLELAWPNIKGYRVGDLLPVSSLTFEGLMFPVPRNWGQYLDQMYGDWRKVPDPKDRHTHLPVHLKFPDGSQWTTEEA